jgi:hypothetical protein
MNSNSLIPPLFLSWARNTAVLLGWFLSSLTALAQQTDVHQTFTIPRGTTWVGLSILKPAVFRGTVTSVASSNQLSVQINSTGPAKALDNLFLEITASPADPTLEGERYFLVSGSLQSLPKLGTRTLAIRASPENSLSYLPTALAGASFAVHPAWTLKDLFGGVDQPPRLRTGPVLAANDTVTIVHSAGQSTYWLKPSRRGFPSWNLTTRSLAQTLNPIIPPGAGLIIRKPGGEPLRFSLAGERRQHLFRRPLRAGPNFLSLPHPETTRIKDLSLIAEQGWASGDILKIWNGWSVRRFQQDPANGRWKSLDSDMGEDVENLPLLAPDRAFILEKASADPDFAVRPLPTSP